MNRAYVPHVRCGIHCTQITGCESQNPALPQVTQALAELGDSFGELLSRRRAGVVAALLAACSRLGAAQSAACRALSRGLTGLPAAGVEQRGLAVSCFFPAACASHIAEKRPKYTT